MVNFGNVCILGREEKLKKIVKLFAGSRCYKQTMTVIDQIKDHHATEP